MVKVLIEPKGTHGLNLYSKGILVKQLHQYTYGFSADVVTKKTLQLNMARNEINENDEVWQHVHKILRAEMRKRRNKNLNEFERVVGKINKESEITKKGKDLIKSLRLNSLLITRGSDGMTLLNKRNGKIPRFKLFWFNSTI